MLNWRGRRLQYLGQKDDMMMTRRLVRRCWNTSIIIIITIITIGLVALVAEPVAGGTEHTVLL